ncbi:HD domain-containing phosphohydrolase [Planctobacterium marinum]|uniref:Two-component system response regulator n=1 Tax=Planctobacterium marinum TaxID=1631968 RepID=A0AA48HX23_9ALTE|nr:two-component system response regulator [Planctobacterium marinum]
MTNDNTPVVLFVDDEANILSSLKRIVRKKDYQSVFASSGAEALEIMQQQTVHLVVSDMKMPQMTGAQLFAKLVVKFPDTYRIILSGYADLASTIDAVNQGKIHRFLQKPWDNDMLLEAIDEGLELVRLKQANERLKSEISAQNKQLKTLNESLEEKVNLRTRQIQVALRKMQGQNKALEKVLYNLININPNLNGEFAKRVSTLARRMALKNQVKDPELREITLAGLLCEIGLISLDPFLYSKPFDELNHQQRGEFYSQTETASMILAPAEYMAGVARMLSQQFLPWSGAGESDAPAYTSIVPGARILHVARDYWGYRSKKIKDVELTHEQTLSQMKKQMGAKYEPELIELLSQLPEPVIEGEHKPRMKSADLQPGMKLKANLYTPEHIMLLAEGHEFTEQSIERVKQFEKSKEITLKLEAE